MAIIYTLLILLLAIIGIIVAHFKFEELITDRQFNRWSVKRNDMRFK
jgi:hypothetical protein